MNEETPPPSRRRGRPPKVILAPIGEPEPILAPPQELVASYPDAPSVASVPTQAPTVPFPLEPPLPPVKADDVDLRETPSMAARHSISGSDSKVRGASDGYLPVEAGTPGLANPALPEQFIGSVGPEPPIVQAEVKPAPAPVRTSWTPVQVSDVVQISSSRSKHLGTLFIVGDIRHHRVHGYQIGLGGKLEYFTVNEDECVHVGAMVIGSGQIRARNGCSAKWKAESR